MALPVHQLVTFSLFEHLPLKDWNFVRTVCKEALELTLLQVVSLQGLGLALRKDPFHRQSLTRLPFWGDDDVLERLLKRGNVVYFGKKVPRDVWKVVHEEHLEFLSSLDESDDGDSGMYSSESEVDLFVSSSDVRAAETAREAETVRVIRMWSEGAFHEENRCALEVRNNFAQVFRFCRGAGVQFSSSAVKRFSTLRWLLRGLMGYYSFRLIDNGLYRLLFVTDLPPHSFRCEYCGHEDLDGLVRLQDDGGERHACIQCAMLA